MFGLYYILYVKEGKTISEGGTKQLPRAYKNPKQSKSVWWIWCLLLLGLWITGEFK